MKTIGFSMVFANFHKFDMCKIYQKKGLILLVFWEAKAIKINKNACVKQCFFPTAIFRFFYRFFAILTQFWETLEAPKIAKHR